MDQLEIMATQTQAKSVANARRQSAISKTEIARLADIARREQVVVEMEADGRVIRVSPISTRDYGGNSIAGRGGVVL
ncbi:hypothetical protein [Rhizobium leguminosarum]|uniref:hypothetical protein n=1 Tax=Rhizobium leguminosarum TaxID=384 RepID=UPI0013F15C1F|nr:hypothetical protein [Rhizobium leguminosarum]MBB4326545.1 hypothetical protein [Rhizobium leguminosarum]MBB4352165.1 hypothetical protein [Rhizobium leguminosarum]MBB4546813.1 hypothetical protein [Rhizobium leguminosarum]MBB4559130.1 hypothetical protein [Rhizobium leguminosarum]